MIRILVIEDEATLAQRIRANLTAAGFVADLASDGNKGWLLGDTQTYDAAVLDLGLPAISGLDVLRRWRDAGRNLPVLILTGRSGWVERVNGLNAGADDYLEKPFQPQELIARIRSLLRRSTGKPDPTIRYADIELNAALGRVMKGGRTVELTALEMRILEYLMHRIERIVSQNELLDHVYSVNDFRDSNNVEVYIARLRKKLGRDAIRTIRGMGYRMG
ncbi:response regulator transcription factor [Bradyrhizobium sp. BR13661]|uniref:response regulator transcription factor n=1 Tax=Bradyrhizobium sp. BR13661 TaxID=2940622 RepID=UPI0032AF24C7